MNRTEQVVELEFYLHAFKPLVRWHVCSTNQEFLFFFLSSAVLSGAHAFSLFSVYEKGCWLAAALSYMECTQLCCSAMQLTLVYQCKQCVKNGGGWNNWSTNHCIKTEHFQRYEIHSTSKFQILQINLQSVWVLFSKKSGFFTLFE